MSYVALALAKAMRDLLGVSRASVAAAARDIAQKEMAKKEKEDVLEKKKEKEKKRRRKRKETPPMERKLQMAYMRDIATERAIWTQCSSQRTEKNVPKEGNTKNIAHESLAKKGKKSKKSKT